MVSLADGEADVGMCGDQLVVPNPPIAEQVAELAGKVFEHRVNLLGYASGAGGRRTDPPFQATAKYAHDVHPTTSPGEQQVYRA